MWSRKDIIRHLDPPLVGMVHLPALPGAPDWGGDLDRVIAAAIRDLDALVGGGLRATMVENFHDDPFWPTTVPVETVAAMTVVVQEIRRRHPDVAVGVNVLRNDAAAALAIAAATGARMIRVNVHAGVAVTDQGLTEGQAHVTLRRRRDLDLAGVGILADLRVKHAAPLAPRALGDEACDLRRRGRADALILTGAATGAATDPDALRRVRAALPDCPLLIGSGLTAETASELAPLADGAVVGTFLKRDGAIRAELVSELLAAWRAAANRKDPAP